MTSREIETKDEVLARKHVIFFQDQPLQKFAGSSIFYGQTAFRDRLF